MNCCVFEEEMKKINDRLWGIASKMQQKLMNNEELIEKLK